MIENFICENCSHFSICNIVPKLKPFIDNHKGYVGMEIEIKSCVNFNSEHDE